MQHLSHQALKFSNQERRRRDLRAFLSGLVSGTTLGVLIGATTTFLLRTL